MNRTLIGVMCVAASLAVGSVSGCTKKEPSCDAVFEHVKELAPAEMRDVFDGSKEQVTGKCEKLTSEQRRCIVGANDLTEVAGCKQK